MYICWWFAIASFIVFVALLTTTIILDRRDRYSITAVPICIVLTGISFVICMTFALVAILVPLKSKEEYNKYIETSEMVQQIYDEGHTLENVGLTQTVIELNTWLSEARANKKMYGAWSGYYNIDLDGLSYMTLKGAENGNNTN